VNTYHLIEPPGAPVSVIDRPPVTTDPEGASQRPAEVVEGVETTTLVTGPHTRRRRVVPSWVIRAIVPVGLIVIWEAAVRVGLLSERTLNAPSTILSALRELHESGLLEESIKASLTRAAIGFAIGLTLGLTLGLITGLFKMGEELLDSTVQMLRTVPFLALIPLFLVWFGIGEQPKIALVAAACTFSVYFNTYAGLRSVDARLIEAGKTFGLSRRAIVRNITLPLAMPTIFVGIRYSMGVSLLALVAAEQVNARSGLGYLVNDARTSLRIDIILAGIVVYALLGLAVDLIVRLGSKVLMPWHVENVGKRR